MRFAHISLFLIVLCLGAVAQPPRPVDAALSKAVEDVYLARDDGEGKAGEVTSTFTPNDIPIHCIVVLAKPDPAAVRMNFVAVKVNGVKPESRVVSAAYATSQGQDRVFFTGKPHGKWTAGSYRIDVFVNDKLEKSIDFDVKGGVLPAASNFAPTKPKPRKPVKKN
ncbi:MAG TPA: hypothetical protein PLK77_12590 [Pyrinomonadaceae bacterium]|nr:hypothetical protein [Pyrinomonadaceae bacterium]